MATARAKLDRCLKMCLYRADTRYHKKHGDPAPGKGYRHIADLVDGCLPGCLTAAGEDKRRAGLKASRPARRQRRQDFVD